IWNAGTEGIFSAVKFGENCVSRCTTGLEAEGYQRFWAYYMNQKAKQLVKAMN
ncbi:MAG: IS5/IS1182 family transposase, partial [Conexivisphaerales archaeon]